MGIRTRNNSQAEARKRFRHAHEAWQANQPRRCKTTIVGAAGECLACDAEQGEACKSDRDDAMLAERSKS